MEYRRLGKTNQNVSVIGVGTEYLKALPKEKISQIISLALDAGINYFDLVWNMPNIVEGCATALKGHREKIALALHLGSCIKSGKYYRSRDPKECELQLKSVISTLDQNFSIVINIHYVANMKIWQEVNKKGIVALAGRLKSEGLAEIVSVSTHDPEVVKLAAQTNSVDSIMYQVNAVNHVYEVAKEALRFCQQRNIGVVAMKPFAGGELLKVGVNVKIAVYKTGWKPMSLIVPKCTSPIRLLSYVLDQPSVCSAVTGVSSAQELATNLTYLTASKEEKEYRMLLNELHRYET